MHPTIGESDKVEEGARLFFEVWLPLTWKKRVQHPDIAIDYRVEVEDQGEPTGKHFLAQVKGRSLHKRKHARFSERFRTKDLRYYLRCEEPVYLFLIDPSAKEGYWLFAQEYIRKRISAVHLREKKSVIVRFETGGSFSDFPKFRHSLTAAWRYMHEMFPGSPLAAVLNEKQKLEQLDSRFSVEITASSKLAKIQIAPKSPHVPVKLTFAKTVSTDQLKALFERGESIRLNAKELNVLDAPLHQEILSRIGDWEIMVSGGHRFTAHLRIQFAIESHETMIQLDGDATVAPKRLAFSGALPESPLKLDVCREPTPDDLTQVSLKVRLCWECWISQPMLSLGHFADLTAFFSAKVFSMRCLVRGNVLWNDKEFVLDHDMQNPAFRAFDWIRRCQSACQRLKINPIFPSSLDELESDSVRLVVELLETGGHIQENDGVISSCTVDRPEETMTHATVGMGIGMMEFSDSEKTFDFLGIKLSLGVLIHRYTNVEVSAVRKISESRDEVEWIGLENSSYEIQMIRS
jgi:hypothetical protein